MQQFSDQEVKGSIPSSVMLTNPEHREHTRVRLNLDHQVTKQFPSCCSPTFQEVKGKACIEMIFSNLKADCCCIAHAWCTMGYLHYEWNKKSVDLACNTHRVIPKLCWKKKCWEWLNSGPNQAKAARHGAQGHCCCLSSPVATEKIELN